MDADGTRSVAIAEMANFLRNFKDFPDDRQAGEVDHPLAEVLRLILLRFSRERRHSTT